MHHDVTLNYVPANTNQRYSNSLLSPSNERGVSLLKRKGFLEREGLVKN